MTDNSPTQPTGYALLALYERMKRRSALLIVIAMAVMMAGVFISVWLQPRSGPPDYGKLGLHLMLDEWPESVWPEHMARAGAVLPDGGFVVQRVPGDDLDSDKWNRFMALAAEQALTPVIQLMTTWNGDTQQWAAPTANANGDYAELGANYAAFIAALDWPGTPHHVILLNAPNRDDAWGGQSDPAAYGRFVVDVAAAIRATDPQARILNGALDLSDEAGTMPMPDFLNSMASSVPDALDAIDIWNSHAHPLDYRQPPWQQQAAEDAPDGVYVRGINSYTWELWALLQLGIDPPPVMITEMGWRHSSADDADYPDVQIAASYLDMALRGNYGQYPNAPRGGWTPLLSDARVIGVASFVFNGSPDTWGHSTWLQLDPQGQILDSYPMVDLVAGYPSDEQE